MIVIVWSPEAESDYESIIDYLLEKWSPKEAESFATEVDRVLDLISINPKLYPSYGSAVVHRAVIVKQVTLFYRVKSECVELIRFWDNRQNPQKQKF